MEKILDAFSEPYHGISFKIADKDWGFTDGSFFANPVCSHAENEKGIKINRSCCGAQYCRSGVDPLTRLRLLGSNMRSVAMPAAPKERLNCLLRSLQNRTDVLHVLPTRACLHQ